MEFIDSEQSFIGKVGGETVLCENGAEAIAIVEAYQAAGNALDVVLMDMQMHSNPIETFVWKPATQII